MKSDQVKVQSFDEQFQQIQKFPFRGALMDIWDIVPKIPSPQAIPLIFIVAWGGDSSLL